MYGHHHKMPTIILEILDPTHTAREANLRPVRHGATSEPAVVDELKVENPSRYVSVLHRKEIDELY